jgi:hypothetical protein
MQQQQRQQQQTAAESELLCESTADIKESGLSNTTSPSSS